MAQKDLAPRANRLRKASGRSQRWLIDNRFLKRGKRYKWILSGKGERMLRAAE